MNSDEIKNLNFFSNKIRSKILDISLEAGASSSHFGGSLSTVDLLSVLYKKILNFDSKNPLWEKRDRFILSKGHACLGFYAILNDLGFITNKELLSEIKCPYCQTGNLVKRKNLLKNNEFLGCSNYPSCNQTFNNLEILENNILCGRCESGFMIRRKGGKGNFFGCTKYPKCKNTINLERYTGKK